MDALLEAPPRPLTLADLAGISLSLAEDVARLPLRRSGYTVADYLSLDGNYLVEFNDGCLQVLPMPTAFHQAVSHVVDDVLRDWAAVADPAARTVTAPFRVYLTETLYREPDVALMLGRPAARRRNDRWDGADLAVEIISDTNRDHDEVTKRHDYAAAGVPEYWLVDPAARSVRLLTLSPGATAYAVHGDFTAGTALTSPLLAGLTVDVADLFAAAARRV